MNPLAMRYPLLAFLVACTTALMAQNYAPDYQKIDELRREGLFRQALNVATQVYSRAERAGDEDEMLKALAHRAAYTFRLEEDGYDAALGMLNEELADNENRPVVAPVVHHLIGKGYYIYARQNGYRLRNATAVANTSLPGPDAPLEDWNLHQLKNAAENHLLQALERAGRERTRLQSIPAIVTGDRAAYDLRPTLFDLLAHESLDLLSNPLLSVGDAGPNDPERLLVPADEFTRLDLADLDPQAGSTRRLRVYQTLLAYHDLRTGGRARLHVDRLRVETIAQYGVDAPALKATYERMYEEYAGVPGRGIFLVNVAMLLYGADEETFGPLPRAQALALLQTIDDKDPRVLTAVEEMRRRITNPLLNVTAREHYGLDDNILLHDEYRNVTEIYHRLVRRATADEVTNYRNYEEKLTDWRSRPAVRTRAFRPPANDDYRSHQTETWLPKVPAGDYILLSGNTPDFDPDNGTVVTLSFTVSNLAVVEHHRADQPHYEVLDRTTGVPRAGLTVTVYETRRRNRQWRQFRTLITDRQGRFDKPAREGSRLRFVVSDPANNDRFTSDDFYSYRNDRRERNRSREFTPLFTDRSIYRPGQTVHVYGITARKSPDDVPELLTGKPVTLTLYDANGQKVEQTPKTSDAFSRFNHSFKLPAGGLTGSFRINTDGGSIGFRVEEYKRPRFRVELTGPDFAVAGATTEATGKATLFAGPGLDGATVNYRVFREEVRYYWWRGGGGGERQAVASGETETDGSGEFTVRFTPAADLSTGRTRFRYVVEADVSDATGETHAGSVSVALRNSKPLVNLGINKDILDVTDTLRVTAAGTEDDLTVAYRIVAVTKPGATLQPRKWAFPDRPVLEPADYEEHFPGLAREGEPELKDWPATAPIASGRLSIRGGKGELSFELSGYPVGHYRVEWNYPDGTFGNYSHLRVVNVEAGKLPSGMLYYVDGPDQPAEVGRPLTLRIIATLPLPVFNYQFGSRNGSVDQTVSVDNSTTITYLPTDADRGGIDFNYNFVRNGDLYAERRRFNLGWDNKKLQIDYATFRDKLRPGTPERWTLRVKNADGSPVSAAALASMYDASLDQIFAGRDWVFTPFPGYYGSRNTPRLLRSGTNSGSGRTNISVDQTYRQPELPALDLMPLNWNGRLHEEVAYSSAPAPTMMRKSRNRVAIQSTAAGIAEESAPVELDDRTGGAPPPPPVTPGRPAATEKTPVQMRANLQETAFWFPDLTANAAGELTVSFDSPEALTSWKFRVLAHDEDLNSAVSEQTIVTQKELMVLPNVPRFLREGDALELTARVNNLGNTDLDVRATVEFFDPKTNKGVKIDAVAGGAAGAVDCNQAGEVKAGAGTTFCFPLTVPEGLSGQGAIGYRIVVRGGDYSDGEENVVPVLTDRTMITVTQPFYLKKGNTKTVTVAGLSGNDSPTLRHVNYSFQATTQPAWIALKSLPYLMEYPYDCTEQIANRYFANQLAYVTVSGKPVLERVFRQWRDDPDALQSELERNPTLKNALLTETPWVRAARSEAAQRARIGELFDLKRLAEEQAAALSKLKVRQSTDGSFPWFPGGRDNRYVTQYVVETLGRLRRLDVVPPEQSGTVNDISRSAVRYLDRDLTEDYRKLVERMERLDEADWRKTYRPSSTVVHYLYARAMSGAASPEDKATKEAFDFYTARAAAGWLDYGLYEQALLAATAAKRATALAPKIIASLRERAIRKDELGMYWKYGRGYRWTNLPIETHCRLLEAFRLAGGTDVELDEMRLWLLTNKRTNRWETTKSTAAAVYALLHTGTDWTTDREPEPLGVRWPDLATSSDLRTGDPAQKMQALLGEAQANAEAKTGAFTVSVPAGDVLPGLGKAVVRNEGNDLVWGGAYWQYTELAQKVAAADGGPLTLERELFHRRVTEAGERLVPITDDTPLGAGDRVVVRLIVRSDRDLDFVHLKDRRAATFEPVEQLSGYRYQNGLGYYQAPGDLATNFFVDRLPRGTYTLEYDLFATFSGTFSNGLGRVQCMYAPEFGANSGGANVIVQ